MSIWTLILLALLAVCLSYVRRQGRELTEQRLQLRDLKHQQSDLVNVLGRRGRRLDVLFSTINEAVMRVDRLGRVLAVNAQASRVFRPSPLLELPQSMLVFYREPEWYGNFIDALKRLPEASALPDMKIGEWVLASRLAPLGKNQALLLCVDMTEQAKLEKQRRTFLSNLMHDLKTPLTSLLGYARSIQSFDDDAGLRKEAAQVIAHEAKYVNSLLDALLTLDRIEFDAKLSNARCKVLQVIQQVCDAYRPQLEAKSIQFRVEEPQQSLTVRMPEEDLHRCLGNVMDNALRHTPDEGAISLDVSADEQERCLIRVCDSGPGVPAEHLGRIGERFYRVDNSRNRMLGGYGLGLAIVKASLENYGGEIGFGNCDPHGLCVQMTIPVDRKS